MARASVFRLVAAVTRDGALSPVQQAQRLAAVAHKGRDDLIAAGRASPRYDGFVDGVPNGDELAAKAEIAYRFRYLGDVVAFALENLRQLSPVLTGRYQASFMVAVDGVIVDGEKINPANLAEASEVAIYNAQPYGRRVDVQLDGTTPLRFSVAPGLFDATARAVRGRFGNLVQVSRVTNVVPPNPWLRKTGDRIGRVVVYPALLIVRR